MKSCSFSLIVIALACTGGTADADPTELFDQVGSILSRRCLACHSDQDTKGGLSLSTEEGFLLGGDSGSAIDTDQPLDSLLFEMISGSSPEMPKDADALEEEEVALIREWLAAGAVWPTGKRLETQQVTDLKWWSLEPLQAVAVPQPNPSDATWIRTPIDAFVIRKLREQNLEPSAEANRRTLIRRLYFDLVGLPPTPERVEAFINDSRPDAYERLVDELLNSPHYGERWARHWLDVVHYGDTHGYDKDKLRPNAWPYRDYVIRSFNSNKPYSRFVREQLAGDVLWPDTIDGIEAPGEIFADPFGRSLGFHRPSGSPRREIRRPSRSQSGSGRHGYVNDEHLCEHNRSVRAMPQSQIRSGHSATLLQSAICLCGIGPRGPGIRSQSAGRGRTFPIAGSSFRIGISSPTTRTVGPRAGR